MKKKKKKNIKIIIDIIMLAALPILAAELQLGQESHEWIGLAVFALFILHHVLNYRWIKGIFKGEYTPVRAFMTLWNLLLLMDLFALAYSGMKMSGYALNWLKIPGSRQTAKILHLFASQWGFLLMAVHAGMHSGLRGKKVLTWLIRVLTIALSIFGIYSFIDLKIPEYLFLQAHLMYFDDAKSLWLYLAEIISTLVLFATAGHYGFRLLKKMKLKGTGKKIAKILSFVIPAVVCAAVILFLNVNPGAGKGPAWGSGQHHQENDWKSQHEQDGKKKEGKDGKKQHGQGEKSNHKQKGRQPNSNMTDSGNG